MNTLICTVSTPLPYHYRHNYRTVPFAYPEQRVTEIKKKNRREHLLRDVVAQGPSESRRMKNIDGYFFPRAMLMLRGTARKTVAFPELANCNGVMVMPKRKRDKGCLYRHTSSPGLTPTRHRSVGRQGVPSPTPGGDALAART